MVTVHRGLPPTETARPRCRPGLGVQMGGVSPEAQPPGGARGGGEERKAGPLTLLPTRPSAVSSILGTWLDQGAEDSQPPSFPASGSWRPPCSSTPPAPTWSTRTSARGRWEGGRGGSRDWPQTARVGTAIGDHSLGLLEKVAGRFPSLEGRLWVPPAAPGPTTPPGDQPTCCPHPRLPFPSLSLSLFLILLFHFLLFMVSFFCLFSFCFLS